MSILGDRILAQRKISSVELTKIPALDFDLAKTLNSGQVFHWEKAGDGFVGAIDQQPVYVEQRGNRLRIVARRGDRLKRSPYRDSENQVPRTSEMVAHYLALDHPLTEICASFPDDPVMNAAKTFCRGLRIIRQPKWECLATFICSSMKQVAHIRQISKKLRERFGEARQIDDYVVHTFPSAERIAGASENELRECGLGYRAKNLLTTARLVATSDACRAGAQRRRVDLEKLETLSDVDLRARLRELPGVGAKVANCVMLFAYERLRAFPIDVWIERVLRQNYFSLTRKLNAAQLRVFTERYFGDHGGYAQQYLFHHARTTKTLEGRALSRPKKFRTTLIRQAQGKLWSSLHDKGARVR